MDDLVHEEAVAGIRELYEHGPAEHGDFYIVETDETSSTSMTKSHRRQASAESTEPDSRRTERDGRRSVLNEFRTRR